MDAYFYPLDDEFFDLGDPDQAGDYADSLDSPCSTGSDIENHIVYDPQSNSLQSSSSPSTSFYNSGVPLHHHRHPPPHDQQGGSGIAPVKKVIQRKAANMRERRRMKCINDAFEVLRSCIPSDGQSDRRLSKVDTLKLAVRYIGYLSDLVRSCGDYGGGGGGAGGAAGGGGGGLNGHRMQEKIIIRCHLADPDPGVYGEDQVLLGHSLSWDDPKGHRHPPNSKLIAKVWVPENPTASDLINLATYSGDY